MPNLNTILIAVIGVGGVGTHFLTQLATLQKTHPNISLILISRSTKTLLGKPTSPISLSTWSQDLSASTSPPMSINETISYLRTLQLPSNRTILIDNTSSQPIADAYPSILSSNISIVTPNKKAFSGPLPLWSNIQKSSYSNEENSLLHGHIYHESSVGAGLPIISTLHDLLATGDTVRKIEGVFSGTMSFLFNTFAPITPVSDPPKWSTVVTTAKEAGYTEPDPRDDLNGLDVARKLVILARIAGLPISSTDAFPVQSLIPSELSSVSSGEEFLSRLPEFDGQMEKIREDAEKEGKVVRFVGSIDVGKQELKVGLEGFGKGDAIAGLKGSDNMVSFYTERYGENPLVVQGAGAGGAVTAMGVTADLIKVIQRVSIS